MGMAASQARFLGLTRRKNDIQCELSKLSMQKMSLTRDMNKVSKEYQASISTKKLQMSCGSANYVDMSYSNLMTPNSVNQNNPYILTDMKGRVVVDEKYKEYAEMISADGTPGDWSECRSEVLARLTGLSEEDIDNADGYYMAFLDNQDALYQLDEQEPLNRSSFTHQDSNSLKNLLQKLGSAGSISDWASAYEDSNQKISTSDISSVMEAINSNLGKYFLEDSDKFKSACDVVKESLLGNPNVTEISVKDLIDKLIGAYKTEGGAFASSAYADAQGNTYPVWYDVDSAAYAEYKQKHDAWQAERDEAERIMKESLEAYNQIFTADKENLIKFYDSLFSTIAEKGWSCYGEVSDSDYLNQMLQNGMFNITTVDREFVSKGNCEYSYENTYNTDIALNCKNVVQVSDSDARDAALVKYEYEKSLINSKESRIDQRMKNLETENAAISQMIQSIQNVINNNIEQNMNIFNA